MFGAFRDQISRVVAGEEHAQAEGEVPMLAKVSRGDVGVARSDIERQFLPGVETQREGVDAIERRRVDLGDDPVDR